MASPCINKAHQEYYCLTKYSVSNHKFTANKWCDPCRELFKDEIESGKIISVETKTRKRS